MVKVDVFEVRVSYVELALRFHARMDSFHRKNCNAKKRKRMSKIIMLYSNSQLEKTEQLGVLRIKVVGHRPISSMYISSAKSMLRNIRCTITGARYSLM